MWYEKGVCCDRFLVLKGYLYVNLNFFVLSRMKKKAKILILMRKMKKKRMRKKMRRMRHQKPTEEEKKESEKTRMRMMMMTDINSSSNILLLNPVLEGALLTYRDVHHGGKVFLIQAFQVVCCETIV